MGILFLCFLGFFAATAMLLLAYAKASRKKDPRRVGKNEPNDERRARFVRVLADPALQARTTRLSERYRELVPEFNARYRDE